MPLTSVDERDSLSGRVRSTVLLLALALMTGCNPSPEAGKESDSATAGDAVTAESSADTSVTPATLTEAYETPRTPSDNIDSPALWHGDNGEHWILATAKEGDAVVVYDATSGETVRRVGQEGTGAAEFDRPNGIVVHGDMAYVIERNNHRIHALRLPSLESAGWFGSDVLRRPYGGTVVPDSGNTFSLYVTDNYETEDEQIPADSLLSERVKQFRVTVSPDTVQGSLVRSFGDTTGAGVLRKVETIWADPQNERLLIAEEDELVHKIYTLDGTFTGEVVGQGQFQYEPEGLVLYACDDGSGYWVATDQDEQKNQFRVFDRTSFEPVGSFSGKITSNTDGVALSQRSFGAFGSGAFIAVHDDQSVSAFRWSDIAGALNLRETCATESTTAASG